MMKLIPSNRFGPLKTALAALAGVLALGGCAATHVGDAWQCPLAQGRACVSVADADPAVAEHVDAIDELAIRTPLYRDRRMASHRSAADSRPGMAAARKTAKSCKSGCNPFNWLADRFKAKSPDRETPDDPAARNVAVAATPPALSAPVPTPLTDDLRTGEVIGRIWIAPFVDEDGIYREAHWIRTVLEPAGWRLP